MAEQFAAGAEDGVGGPARGRRRLSQPADGDRRVRRMVQTALHPSDPLRAKVDQILAAGRRSADSRGSCARVQPPATPKPVVLDLRPLRPPEAARRLIGEDVHLGCGSRPRCVLADPGAARAGRDEPRGNSRDAIHRRPARGRDGRPRRARRVRTRRRAVPRRRTSSSGDGQQDRHGRRDARPDTSPSSRPRSVARAPASASPPCTAS
jgi:hypothetical protein